MNPLYIGIKTDDTHHITLNYIAKLPTDVKNAIISKFSAVAGLNINLKAVGYGNYIVDGAVLNTGVIIELPAEIKPFFKGKIPHITTFVAENSKPVNTGKMNDFHYFDTPKNITGTLGFFGSQNSFSTIA